MRTFKEHILEKLKVTSKTFITPTYKEFYDLLDEYAKVSGEIVLISCFSIANFSIIVL